LSPFPTENFYLTKFYNFFSLKNFPAERPAWLCGKQQRTQVRSYPLRQNLRQEFPLGAAPLRELFLSRSHWRPVLRSKIEIDPVAGDLPSTRLIPEFSPQVLQVLSCVSQ
jgi:hypothetical protein